MILIVWIVSLMPISWANPKNPWKLPDISNDPKCGVCECFRAPIPELYHLNTMMADCSKLQLNAIPKELPDDIGFLNLEFNNIKQITKEVLPFPQLKFLCVKENSITSLQNDTFSNLNELQVLDVTGNRIMNIPKGIFQSLKKLRNIQGLYVDTVPVGMLSHLKLLQELQLTTEEAAVPVNLFKIGFEFMDRELLWHGFAEFLFFALPLINFRRMKNYISRILLPQQKVEGSMERCLADLKECVVCGEWPFNPQEIGCLHVFCYYCIHANYKADPGFSCPLCGKAVERCRNIQPVTVKMSPNMSNIKKQLFI